jgi:hypothetical protein
LTFADGSYYEGQFR